MTARSKPIVNNFVWMDGRLCEHMPYAIRRGEHGARLTGQYAIHVDHAGHHTLVRDALGVVKLFFAISTDGEVHSSNYIAGLVQQGHRLADINSVPSGHVLCIEPSSRRFELRPHTVISFAGERGPSLEVCATAIRRALASMFEHIAAMAEARPVFVTLSGGLDSTVIAVLACEHLRRRPVGLTFVLEGNQRRDTEDSDLWHASRVARWLGMEFEVIRVRDAELVSNLDDVLLFGQDYRDFNVHCGAINDAIARWLAERHQLYRCPLVLTGDGMNELVADYTPVDFHGHRYYDLPRLPADQLRRFLVAGLDSGDREIGIFAAHGIDVIQPYLLCAETYAAIPGRLLCSGVAKQELVRHVMGDRVPEHVYGRPKVRAQVASSGEVSGTLAAFALRGIDADALAQRFAELLGATREEIRGFIRGGLYRFATTYGAAAGPTS